MWAKRRGQKFGATRTNHAGRSFASKLEASVFDLLTLREKAGEIRDIRCQHTVDLGFDIRWRVDYSFEEVATSERVWAEAKGLETPDYALKLKLWRNGCGPGRLEIWKGTHVRPRLVEVVKPHGMKQAHPDCVACPGSPLADELESVEAEGPMQ